MVSRMKSIQRQGSLGFGFPFLDKYSHGKPRVFVIQLCRHQWQGGWLLWQPTLPPVTTKLVSWQRSVFFNPKETSWDLLGPMTYKLYHCVSVRNCFPWKFYVFLKSIVLHNIMCEKKNWILSGIQFCRLFREKATETTRATLVLNLNEMTSLFAAALNTESTASGLHSSIGWKGHSLQGYTGSMTEIQWKIAGSKRPLSVLYASFAQRW